MNEIARILIVEDDATIRCVLEMALLGAGYGHVESCARGDEALARARQLLPDLILLDVMLPGLDGFTLCQRLREQRELAEVRILMLTARTQNEDIIRGLECGADDYVTKPFDRRVLLARIRALLRRTSATVQDFDGLKLDEEAHQAVLNGEVLHLTPGELRLLALLVAHRGRVLARAHILDAVQRLEREVTERTVDVQIANLRRKLGPWASHIETIRGVGYRVDYAQDQQN